MVVAYPTTFVGFYLLLLFCAFLSVVFYGIACCIAFIVVTCAYVVVETPIATDFIV